MIQLLLRVQLENQPIHLHRVCKKGVDNDPQLQIIATLANVLTLVQIGDHEPDHTTFQSRQRLHLA